ncbi:MAG: translocation/assembly module TamB domain-containing protein [Desulfosarcinaceae bacterium]|nr:translocation/assembly module TamB domain-containing protein [Desulfosarcinaceae bacterium]
MNVRVKPAMRKTLKLTAIGLAGLTLLAGCLTLGAIGLINTDLARRTLLGHVNARLNGRLSVENHRLALFRSRLELQEVVLLAPNTDPLVELDRLVVDWRWRDLLKGTLYLSEVALDAPRGYLVVDADGRLNLLEAFPIDTDVAPSTSDTSPDRGKLPINIVLGDLHLQHGRLDYRDLPSGLHLRLADLAADADADLHAQRGRLNLRLAGLDIGTPRFDTHISAVDLRAALAAETLHLQQLSITTEQQQGRLQAQGRAEGFGPEARLDFRLTLDGELAQWNAFLPADRPLKGPLSAELSLTGLLGDPTVRLKAFYGGGHLAGVAMRAAKVDLGLKERQLTLSEVTLQPADGELAVTGEVDLRAVWPKGFLSSPIHWDQLRYQLALRAHQLPLHLLPQLPAGYGGRLGAEVALSGSGIAPHTAVGAGNQHPSSHADLSGTLTVSDGQTPLAGTPVAATIATDTRLTGGQLEVVRLALTAPEATLAAHGLLDVNAAKVSAEMQLHAADLSRLQSLAGLEHLTGEIKGDFTVTGHLNRPEVRFNLDGRNLAAQAITLGDLALAGNLSQKGELAIERFALINQASRIDAQGRLQLPMDGNAAPDQQPLEATLMLQTVTAADFVAVDLAQGQLDGKVELGGTLGRPLAEARLTGQRVAVADTTLGDLALVARIEDGVARILELTLRNGDSRLTIDGEVSLYDPAGLSALEDPSFRLDIEAPVLEISDFYGQAQGRLSLEGALKGSRSAPTAELRIQGGELLAAGQRITELGLELGFADHRLTVDRLVLALAEDARIEGNGWLGVTSGRPYEVSLHSTGIPLARIAALQDQEAVAGHLSFEIKGDGHLSDPALEGDIRFTEMQLNQKPIDDGHLRLTVAEGQASVTGGLNFDIDASYRWASQALEVALTFEDTELAPYLTALGQPDLAGKMDGAVRAQGDLSQPKNFEAQIDLAGISLTYKGQPLLSASALQADLAEQTLRLRPIRLRLLEEGILAASGEMSVTEVRELRVDGQLPLAVVNPFLGESSDLAGQADLQLSLAGEWKAPRIDATISFDAVGMTLPLTFQKLHQVRGNLRYDGQLLAIETLTGQLDDGRFALDGRATIQGTELQEADLSFEARQLPVVVPDTLDLKLDSDLRLVGNMTAASLNGDVTLLEGLYYKDVKLNLFKAATTRRRAQTPPAVAEPNPTLEAVSLDVRIGHRRPFFVNNNLADLQLAPDLQVGGTLAQPVISGRAQVTEGELSYQRKTFVINRGVIDFIDPYRIVPEVEVASETRVRDWLITLDVSGTPDALLFKLASDPPEEDNDILSLLLLGRTSRELIAGEGGSNQSTQQMLANLAASTMGEDLKRVAGVDILEVDTANDAEDPNSERIQVTVGKKLSRRMTLKYALESKAGFFTRRVISEYKLIDELAATGFQDSEGMFGGELLFRLEFR